MLKPVKEIRRCNGRSPIRSPCPARVPSNSFLIDVQGEILRKQQMVKIYLSFVLLILLECLSFRFPLRLYDPSTSWNWNFYLCFLKIVWFFRLGSLHCQCPAGLEGLTGYPLRLGKCHDQTVSPHIKTFLIANNSAWYIEFSLDWRALQECSRELFIWTQKAAPIPSFVPSAKIETLQWYWSDFKVFMPVHVGSILYFDDSR